MARKSKLAVYMLTFLQAAIAAKISAKTNYVKPEFNVTSKTDDYALQNQRQYLAVIKSLIDELDAYKSNYAKQLETINTQLDLLEGNLLNIEQRLIPLELLNDGSKYCVQKYKARLPSVAATKSKIISCTSSAQSSYANIVSSAQTAISNMNSFMNNQFKSGLDTCAKLYTNVPSNYTQCIIKAIANADSNIATYRNTFNTQMQQSTCSGNNRVKQAVECSFTDVYSSIYTSGEVMNLINNCIDDKEFCPPCAVTTNPTPTRSCPNVVNMQLTPTIYTNRTIVNPFRGLEEGLSCVEVQFQPTYLKSDTQRIISLQHTLDN